MNVTKYVMAIGVSTTLMVAGCAAGADEQATPSPWTLSDGGWWATVTEIPSTTIPGGTSRPGGVVTLGGDLLFEFGSSRLTDNARDIITAITADLLTSGASVRVSGHADVIGSERSEEANIRLSTARAEEVAEAMIAAGFPKARIVGVEGYGSARPRALPADTPSNRALNRRVEIERLA